MTAKPTDDSEVAVQASGRQNPYIGPRPFADNERERRFFFGRDRESADLFSLVISDRIVLFYAPSGAGKSSLINARLLPALRAEGFDILGKARAGGQLPAEIALDAIDNVYMFNLLRDLDQGRDDYRALTAQRLPPYLAAHPADPERPDRVLIIDQFEEIFTTYEDHWEKREDFFRQLSQALADDPHLWVMLTMREDYIAELDSYARLLPHRIRVRYRLRYMDAAAALEAVKSPAELGGRPFEPGVAENLVNNLRQMAAGHEEGAASPLGETVEPVQLQVVCMQLWENLSNRAGATITADDVESLARGKGLGEFVNHALATFYEQTLAAVLAIASHTVSERELRDWFSHTLITRDETRNLLYQSDTETGGMFNTVVLELERRFLLRGETRSGGRWVELVHDRLIDPILEANEQWRRQHPLVVAADLWNGERSPALLLNGEALAEAQAQLRDNPARYGVVERHFVEASADAETKRQQQQRLEEEKRKKEASRARVIALGASLVALLMFLLMVASVWLAVQSFNNYQLQQAATALAKSSTERANEASALAEARAADAVQARARTEQLNRQIRADQLASQAVLSLDQSPQQALLLAVEALRMDTDADAQLSHAVEQSMHDVLYATGGLPLTTLSDNSVALVLSPDAQWFATANANGAIQAWWMADDVLQQVDLAAPQRTATWALAAAPDHHLAAVGDDGLVRIWQMDAPSTPPLTFTVNETTLDAAAFSPDSRWLATAGDSGLIYLWDAAAPDVAPQTLSEHTDAVTLVAFSPDGRWLASGGADNTVWLWPIDQPDQGVLAATHASFITGIAFSPDSTRLASGDNDGEVQIYTLSADGAATPAAATRRLPGHTAPIKALGFSSNGVWLATGDANGVLRVWNLNDDTRSYVVRAYASVLNGLAFVLGRNGEALVTTGYDGLGASSVRLWNYTNVGLAPVTLRGHDDIINQLATAPSVNGFITAGYDQTLRIWLIDNPHAEPTILAANSEFIDELAAVPVSATLYSIGAAFPAVQAWDTFGIAPHTPLTATGESGMTALAADPAGALIAAGDAAGVIYLWTPAVSTPFATLAGHIGKISGVAIQPGNRLLASAGDDGAVRLWEIATATEARLLARGDARATALQFSLDGAQLAVGDSDGVVTIWQIDQPDATPTRWQAGDRELSTVAFSPDATRVAAGDLGGRVWVWELAEPGRAARVWDAHANEVNMVTFGADRNQLMTASADSTVRLWHLDAALPIPAVLTGHRESVNSVVYADGMIFTASTDGTLRRWLLAPDDLAARACMVAGRNLAQEEWRRFLPDIPCRATCPDLPNLCEEPSR